MIADDMHNVARYLLHTAYSNLTQGTMAYAKLGMCVDFKVIIDNGQWQLVH